MPKQSLARHWLRLWRRTVGTRWSRVIDLRGSALAWVLATQERRIWRADQRGHRVEQLGRLLGLDPPPAPVVWPIAPAASHPMLGLGPTANFRGKQWPADRFIALAKRLRDGPLAGLPIAVFASPTERAAAAPVLSAFPDGIDLIDTGDLRRVAGYLQACRLFIGNDSGLMHLAAASGAATLGLFGPSLDQLYRPWGPRAAYVRTTASHSELWATHKRDPATVETMMASLSVERAEAAALELLARTA
jgi:ADP-heptose:LPS heptosyltransferase